MTSAAAYSATRRRLAVEVGIVLALSLGESAVRAVISLVEKLTRGVPLAAQTTSMNRSIVPDRPWLDLSYQLANNLFPLAAVALVLYLLITRPGPIIGLGPGQYRTSGIAALGLSWQPRRIGGDVGFGVALAAGIGIPGLALYLAARQLGINTNVAAANLGEQWWTVPILLLAAFSAGATEEIIMVGYVFVRLRQIGWSWVAIIVGSALVRGTYHLYQGFGGFVGNVIMGIIFGYVYWRWRRVGPLVVAHMTIDIAAFVGYALLAGRVPGL